MRIMQRLREKMAIFLWIIAVVFILFIFFDFGRNIMMGKRSKVAQGIIGMVGKIPLSYKEFSRRVSERMNRFPTGSIGPDPRIERAVSDQVFNEMVVRTLVSEELERMGIKITPQVILEAVKTNPPPEVLQDSTFWKEGRFDYEKYLELLRSPQARPFVAKYIDAVQHLLPQQLAQTQIGALVRVTRSEVLKRIAESMRKLEIEYLFFDYRDYAPSSIPDEELRAYYEANREKFKIPETIVLKYVVFPLAPGGEEENLVKEDAEFIVNQWKRGTPFEELARTYSQEPQSAQRGGDIGWQKKEDFQDKDMAKFVFRIKKGGVDIYKGKDGYYIFYVEDKKRNEVRLKYIFLSLHPSMERYLDVRRKAENFINSMKEVGEVALSGMEVKEIKVERGKTPELPVSFGDFLDKPEVGKISRPLPGADGIYVFWIDRIEPERIPPFEEVRDKVAFEVSKEKGIENAWKMAMQVRRNLKEMKKVKGAKYGKVITTLSEPALPSETIGAALAGGKGRISPPVKTDEGVYIVSLKSVKDPSEDEIKEKVSEFYQELITEKKNLFFTGWLRYLREKHPVEDYRYELEI